MPAFKFKGVDFIEFDSLLSEDERLVRDTTRKFIEENVVPIIEQCNREGRFPRELVKPMGELGYFGASLKGYGCAGMSNVEYGLLTQELERGDSGLRSFVSVQSSLVMYPIYAFGSKEQKDRWLPRMATGGAIRRLGLPRRGDRLLRPDRARLRLQPRRHADPRPALGERLGLEREQAVDHQWHPRRR